MDTGSEPSSKTHDSRNRKHQAMEFPHCFVDGNSQVAKEPSGYESEQDRLPWGMG